MAEDESFIGVDGEDCDDDDDVDDECSTSKVPKLTNSRTDRKGILKIKEASAKTRIFSRIASSYGARGIWICPESTSKSPETISGPQRKTFSNILDVILSDVRWHSVLAKYDEIFISIPSASAADKISSAFESNETLNVVSQKLFFVLPEAAPDDEWSKMSRFARTCREVKIRKADYDFDVANSRFVINKIVFSKDGLSDANNEDARVDGEPEDRLGPTRSTRHPVCRYFLSFDENDGAAHDNHFGEDLYHEWDLIRTFLLKRSTSCLASSLRHPRHLIYHKVPICIASFVSSGRQLTQCARHTAADAVVVDFDAAFDNPGIFDVGERFVTVGSVSRLISDSVAEEDSTGQAIADGVSVLKEFWRRRILSMSALSENGSQYDGDDVGNDVGTMSRPQDSESAIVSRWFDEIDQLQTVKELDDFILAFSSKTASPCLTPSAPFFVDLPCAAPGGNCKHLAWRIASSEDRKKTKMTKREKFELKKSKLKENSRRKKEIAKLKRRFVRDDDDDDDDDVGGEGDGHHDDGEERKDQCEPRNKRSRTNSTEIPSGFQSNDCQRSTEPIASDVPPSHTEQQQPIRRAEAQFLKRQRVRALLQTARTEDHVKDVLKVAIDLSFGLDVMSEKEMGKLASQVRRVYGSNRQLCGTAPAGSSSLMNAVSTSANILPARLDLFGLASHSPMKEKLETMFSGFGEAIIGKWEEGDPRTIYGEAAKCLEFVVLTPDSENILTEVTSSCVYILGGLVDESVTKNLTLVKSLQWNFTTARLPIEDGFSCLHKRSFRLAVPKEFMAKSIRDVKCGQNFNPVLTINQVFDILSSVFRGGDWPKSLTESVPRRKGFVLKQ